MFICQLKSERIKLSGTSFFLLHLLIPVLGIIIFIAHLGTSTISVDSLTGGYYQMLGLVYIIIVALLTTMVSEQEVEAGGGFLLLSFQREKSAVCKADLFAYAWIVVLCFSFTGIWTTGAFCETWISGSTFRVVKSRIFALVCICLFVFAAHVDWS